MFDERKRTSLVFAGIDSASKPKANTKRAIVLNELGEFVFYSDSGTQKAVLSFSGVTPESEWYLDELEALSLGITGSIEYAVAGADSSKPKQQQSFEFLNELAANAPTDFDAVSVFCSDWSNPKAIFWVAKQPGKVAELNELWRVRVVVPGKFVDLNFAPKSTSSVELENLSLLPSGVNIAGACFDNRTRLFKFVHSGKLHVAKIRMPSTSTTTTTVGEHDFFADAEIKKNLKNSVKYAFDSKEKTLYSTFDLTSDAESIKAMSVLPFDKTRKLGWIQHPGVFAVKN